MKKRAGLFSYGIALSVFFCSTNFIVVGGNESIEQIQDTANATDVEIYTVIQVK